jgi:tetratricopeptide (TPR) repeat protein
LGDTGPNTWLAQGDAANSGGQSREAELAWLHAVAAGSHTAHRRLALLYEQEGRLTEAAAQWQALGPADAQAQEHVGLLALQAGNYAAARTAFVAARTLPGAYGQEAVDAGFVTLAALPPQDAAGLATMGIAFVQAGMPALARRPLEQAVALDPSYGPAHAFLAWVRLASGEHAAAETEAAAALRLAPGVSFGWFVAAEVAMEAAQWSLAVNDLQAGITHDNHNPVLWAALGRAYLGQHDYVHADLSLDDAAQLGSEPEFTIALLDFYVAHGIGVGLGRAARAAGVALRGYPANAQVAVLAGEVYEMSSDVDQAYAAYRLANTLDPSSPDPYFYLGRIALNGGDYDLATLDLSTYLALRPSGDLAAQARKLARPLGWFDL